MNEARVTSLAVEVIRHNTLSLSGPPNSARVTGFAVEVIRSVSGGGGPGPSGARAPIIVMMTG